MKSTGAIIYLSKFEREEINNLKKSLFLLNKHFNSKFNYPIVIFHENLPELEMNELRKICNNLSFEKIKFKIPRFIDKKKIPENFRDSESPRVYDIGYRHMCRFFAKGVYQHPSLKNYEYIWRLDSDSFIIKRIDYDLFQFMKSKGFLYGSISFVKEDPKTVLNLLEFTHNYINKNKIKTNFFKEFDEDGKMNMKVSYTNFEISKRELWKRKDIKKYLDYIDKLGGIYYYRWGDAPIHTYAISIFLKKKQIHLFKGISYIHKDFFQNQSINFLISKKVDIIIGKIGILINKISPQAYLFLKKFKNNKKDGN